jgi:hypothetical protein
VAPLTERYADQIAGCLSCFDRIVITGSLPGICYAKGMESYLYAHDIRIFDYQKFAEPLRNELRENAERLAREQDLEIEFIRSTRSFRKEERIQEILQARGDHPGLVHIFSALEPCTSFERRYDAQHHRPRLIGREGKCLHYYFYFIDPDFGLCYLRVPTWAPFRLQFYCNGHAWLANRLRQEGIACRTLDNTFAEIGDWQRAQELADAFPVKELHQALDHYATRFCPVLRHFEKGYHWSLMQVEYATDVVFRRQEDLRPLYEALVHTAIQAVKPGNVATFLGRVLHPLYQDEVGNHFHTRIEGTRIKHHMGPASIKMYDKHALVLRIETTVNDVSFFKHHRQVEHRDGTTETKLAPMQKTIYSIGPLRGLLAAANRRYLTFLSELADPSAGVRTVERLAEPARQHDRAFRGFNLFRKQDLDLFVALCRGEWLISGFHNRSLRRALPQCTGPQISRLLKRLHVHGLIRKVGRTYKYYLTKLGQEVALTALKLRELVVIPTLAGVPTP